MIRQNYDSQPSAADNATSCSHHPKQAVATVNGRLSKVWTVSSTLSRTLDHRDPTDANTTNSEATARGPTTVVPRLREALEAQRSICKSSRIQAASNQRWPRNET
ncbi:hypothetical protein CORC01_11770 [Colletotrichum orchidophilum]|uniref:Uncharacterized protein n=1 Tax=Colletotrichum orchidophilum TaxID=1209926 RepID=A0A1G4AUZ5_9PEZI|nr:uncharacterized protein CORC01_11770 [Colletotrichum orchidophilum]OHE92903.1 hypothetical protein CORC01_11770 [Colletotrichum orchidophilum]